MHPWAAAGAHATLSYCCNSHNQGHITRPQICQNLITSPKGGQTAGRLSIAALKSNYFLINLAKEKHLITFFSRKKPNILQNKGHACGRTSALWACQARKFNEYMLENSNLLPFKFIKNYKKWFHSNIYLVELMPPICKSLKYKFAPYFPFIIFGQIECFIPREHWKVHWSFLINVQ